MKPYFTPFDQTYNKLFRETIAPIAGVIPMQNNLQYQLLEKRTVNAVHNAMKICKIDETDPDLGTILNNFSKLRRMECEILFKCGRYLRRETPELLPRFAQADTFQNSAGNYVYDVLTHMLLKGEYTLYPPFLDSHDACESLYEEIYQARHALEKRFGFGSMNDTISDILFCNYDLLRFCAVTMFDYATQSS